METSRRFELRPYQRECIEALPQRGAFLIHMATGLGKCFAAGTPILMHDGSIKPIEEIAAGESVMGVDGTPRLVGGIARGVEEMFRVTPTKGDPYVVNGSHILSLKITGIGHKCVTDSLGRKYLTGDICNISVRDYLLCSSTFQHVAKGWRVSVDFPYQPLNIPPYVCRPSRRGGN